MSNELGRLLLKALAGLPPQEQAALLGGLLEGRRPDEVVVLGGPATLAGPGTAIGTGMGTPPGDGSASDVAFALTREIREARDARPAGAGPDSALKVLPVRLPATEYDRLRRWARSHDFSMAVIIRTLIERFLDGQGGSFLDGQDGRGQGAEPPQAQPGTGASTG